MQMSMVDLEGSEGYRPSAELLVDNNKALINLIDSTELLLLKLPSVNVSFSLDTYGLLIVLNRFTHAN